MPREEVFFERDLRDRRIQVVKTYDQSYAREVFEAMNSDATSALADALKIAETYAQGDIPDVNNSDYEDFIWEELCEAAREDVRLDPNLYSFFVVSETTAGKTEGVFVSPDWPSADKFAQNRLK